MVEKQQCFFVSFRRWAMGYSAGQGDSVFVTEQIVDRHGVIERLPAIRAVFPSSGDEEGARRHQGMQLGQVAALFK